MIKDPDSLAVLTLLGQHHEFMESIKHIAVMGDSTGEDTAWWSDYWLTQGDDSAAAKLNITVYDTEKRFRNINKRKNISLANRDMSDTGAEPNSVDLIWASNCLQKSTNPLATLKHWWEILKEDGMLCMSVPQTSYIDDLSHWQMKSYSSQYFSWNMLNLIQCLAVNGFDCRDGHFKQTRHDPHIWGSVYKGKISPMDPAKTNWYHLHEAGLTPYSLDNIIHSRGYISFESLKVEWLDHSIYDLRMECLP
jgi:trans-aconitate methyltransferase